MRLATTVSLLILGALVVVFGVSALSGLVQTNAVCSGDVVDTALCEGAQLRQSIFGGVVGAALIIGAALLAGASLIAGTMAGNSVVPPSDKE